jgi:hypothetical protein
VLSKYSPLLLLPFVLTACASSEPTIVPDTNMPAEVRSGDQKKAGAPIASQTPIPDGEYPVQQATFDDSDGEYSLMLLNAPTASFKTRKLQMARLTDEQIKEGKKSYLKVENQQPSLYLTEDFKLEYVHNVSEERVNPNTGRSETTVVRQESNFWSPFAGSLAGGLAGQAIGSMLFRPQYYMPPQFQSGGLMSGYGGYGRTYGEAVNTYQQRYQQPPAVEQNRTAFRSNGRIRSGTTGSSRAKPPQDMTGRDRSTGSGFGSSNLKNGATTRSRTQSQPRSGSFGSGRSSRSSGFGSRSRGRR